MDTEATRHTLARTAALVSDPARATMLLTLLDGRPHSASELAWSADISAQTASFHLKKLTSARFLHCARRGKYRYFTLAGPEVGRLLEALLAIDRMAHPAGAVADRQAGLPDARIGAPGDIQTRPPISSMWRRRSAGSS